MMRRRAVVDFEDAYVGWKRCARGGEGENALLLDLGQGCLNSLYAKVSEAGSVSVLDYAQVEGTGFRDGAVADRTKFEAAVGKALDELRRRNRLRARRLHVSLSAPFIAYFNHFATVHLQPRRRVTQRLIDQETAKACGEISSLVEHVMQVVPARYTLDSIYSGCEPPLGMSGQQLGIELFLLTAPRAALEQIEKTLKELGYSVASWCYAGLSAAESVMRPSDEAGVAVVDIGEGSTDVAVYQHDRLLHVGSVGCAGRDFDSDLAVFLNENITVAEEVKRQFGCALPQVIKYNEVVDLKDSALTGRSLVPAREIAAVIRDRAQELFYSVEEEIGRGLSPKLLSRVVLTGGGAKLAGIAELAEIVLGRQVEVGAPRVVNGTIMGFSDPGCAALIGTLRLVRRRMLARRRSEAAGMTAAERVRAWLGWLVGSRAGEEKGVV